MTSRRIALINNKGGVGKTLIALLIAEAAARRGRRVLVVDMDPQANSTRRLRVDLSGGTPTLTEALRIGDRTGQAAHCLYSSFWFHGADDAGLIDVLPADLDLEDRSLEAGQPGAANRLRRALYGLDDSYDLTLIDCPPSIKGHLTVMALAALDGDRDAAILPVTPEADAIGGALRAMQFLRLWRADLGVPNADVAGLVVNGVRVGTTLHDGRLAQLADTFPDVPLLGQPIPLRARLAELQDRGEPVLADRDLGATRPAGDDRDHTAGYPPTGVVASAYAIADALLAPAEVIA